VLKAEDSRCCWKQAGPSGEQLPASHKDCNGSNDVKKKAWRVVAGLPEEVTTEKNRKRSVGLETRVFRPAHRFNCFFAILET
jgi:hypothetical protein